MTPKQVVEDDEDMFEDDRDDVVPEEDDEELMASGEDEEDAEEEEAPVAKKASKSVKPASKNTEDSTPKKAAVKVAKKSKAVEEDAEEERPNTKGKEVKKMNKTEKKNRKAVTRGPVLAGFFSKPKTIHATYHGKTLKATVTPDGMIKFNGKEFTSPSGAGSSIRKGKSKVDGWLFWKIQDNKGELVSLDSLRQKKSA